MQADKKSNEVIKDIDGKKLKEMFIIALKQLNNQKQFIDSLNVFPVPDGDTGTNMYLTFLEGVKKIKKINSNRVDKISSIMARGALMGARGNSGVILSQLLRGFSDINKNNEKMDSTKLTAALKEASEVAYQGVMKPVEGTILTVSKAAARGAEVGMEKNLNLISVFESSISQAQQALNNTPEQLPELKEAGVVDAGGQGYLTILQGMLNGLIQKDNYFEDSENEIEVITSENLTKTEAETETITYTYDTQILIDLNDRSKNIDEIRDDLQNYGDSLIVVGSDNTIKVHIHSNHPGIVLEYALKLGDLSDIVVENMKIQAENVKNKNDSNNIDFKSNVNSNEKSNNKQEHSGKRGYIAVAQGEGFRKIFYDLGVNKVITGGQSMNPSTNDFLDAIKKIDTETIFVFPNNKNIISAANQAASLSNKKVVIIPTHSIPEAISALIVNNNEVKVEKIKQTMNSEIKNIKTCKITEAIKKSSVDGLEINKGDILGLCDDSIITKGESWKDVIKNLFKKTLTNEDLITIYYGQEITETEAEEIKEMLQNEFNIDEIEIYNGGQTLYPYIISLEE